MKLALCAVLSAVSCLGALAACSSESTETAGDSGPPDAAADATQPPLDAAPDAPPDGPRSDGGGDAEATTLDAGPHDASQGDASDAAALDATGVPVGKLAFAQFNDAGVGRVGVLPLVDGGVPAFVTGLPGSQSFPSLSADGKRLLFTQAGASKHDLFVADPDGKNARYFMPCGDLSATCGQPQVAANGDVYFFYEDLTTLAEIRIATPSADGGFAVHTVLPHPNVCYLSNPVISPDGTKLALEVLEADGCQSLGLYVIPLPFQGLNTPVPLPSVWLGVDENGLWFSETGDRIYYIGGDAPGSAYPNTLYSAKLDGSDSRVELAGAPHTSDFAGGAVAHDSTFYDPLADAGIVGYPLRDSGPVRTVLPGQGYGGLVWAP
jgi:hypothetical protein